MAFAVCSDVILSWKHGQFWWQKWRSRNLVQTCLPWTRGRSEVHLPLMSSHVSLGRKAHLGSGCSLRINVLFAGGGESSWLSEGSSALRLRVLLKLSGAETRVRMEFGRQ